MFSLSHLYVAAHQAEMLNLAANERLARPQATTASRIRLSASISTLWSLLGGPAERPLTPNLDNYPFRG
ncbi:MAG TPA: hypothetical protein VGJ71_01500 [Candidatus Limnocylindrales bacterium]